MIQFTSLRLLSTKLLILSVLSFNPHCCHSQVWSGNGPDSNWSTASNWVGGVAPISSNTTVVTFDDPTANPNPFQNIGNPFVLTRLDINSTAGAFSLNGQAIEFDHQFGNFGNGVITWQGSNPINVSNDWIFNVNTFATSLSGPGNFELTHSGDIRGSGNFTITQGRSLISTGTMSGTGRVTVGGLGAELTINGMVATSVQSIQVGQDGNFAQNAGWLRGTGVINSNVTVPDATAQSNRISSTGTLTINGNIDLGPTGSNGSLSIASGIIAVNGQTNIGSSKALGVSSGATLGGTGGVFITQQGILNVVGTVTPDKTINLSGGSNDARIAGSEGTINSVINFAGGRITGNLVLNNAINVNSGAGSISSFFGNGTEPFFAASTLTVNNDVSFLGTNSAIGGTINGTGRLRIETGVNTNIGNGGADISGVTMVIKGTGSLFGGAVVMNANSNTRLENGVLNFAPSSVFTSNGNIVATGNSSITGIPSTGVSFNGLNTVESGTLAVGGIMEGTGSMTVLEGANQTLQNSSTRMRLTLNVFGNLVGTTGSRYENTVNLLGATMSGPLTMDGPVNVGNNEISNLLSGSTMSVAGLTSVNTGTLRIAANANLTGTGNLIVNPGAILDVQGTVSKNIQVAENGILRGVGELIGTIEVQGMLEPGNSAGTKKINGTLELGTTSTVCIEVGGTTPGTGFDEVRGVGSSPTLVLRGGDLMLSLINGFVPDPTHQLSIFNGFTSITGTFGNTGGGDSDRIYFDGGSFAIDYAATSIVLSDFQPVPEPGIGMVLTMSALVLSLRRRR